VLEDAGINEKIMLQTHTHTHPRGIQKVMPA